MNPATQTRAQEVLQQTRQLAQEWVRPHAAQWQRDRVIGLDGVQQAARMNLLGIQVPVEQGGLGLPFSVKCRMAAILPRRWPICAADMKGAA
jgi:alkylation response protein AidB-like acyl-CoA dehydrogenase